MKDNNIIMIGMPGSGKSTVGLLLAKSLGFDFFDTDLIIQRRDGRRLHEIISETGLSAFLELEEAALLSLNVPGNTVIATGGSAVFSRRGMTHLKASGKVLYLDVPVEVLKKRIGDMKTRGIAAEPGDTVEEILAARKAYYEEYADITIKSSGTAEETLRRCAEINWTFPYCS